MRGRGLFLTISHLLYDAALVDGFVSVDEIGEFLDEPKTDVEATIQVLHNVMVAVTKEEYLEVVRRITPKLGNQNDEAGKTGNRYPLDSKADRSYTLNPIVASLIEKGIGSTPIYEALRLVISELLGQWESAAEQEKLGEFTSRLSKDHKEGMFTEISRRLVLKETCEITEEEKSRIRDSPLTVERFKRICVSKFIKAHELGRKLNVHITPSDVISYVSDQLKREQFPL